MVNKKLDEAVLDTVLEQAFAEAFKRDIAKIEEENKDMPEHPKKYVDMERAYYKKKTKPKTSGMLVFRKVAACVMAVLSVGFITVLAVPDVRASVWDSAVGWFENHVTFWYVEEENSFQIGEFTVGYIPKEFEMIDSFETPIMSCYVFSNNNDSFKITINNQSDVQVKYDNENGDVEKIKVNDQDAYMIYHENDAGSIIWNYQGKAITVEGNIEKNILIKIAENLS